VKILGIDPGLDRTGWALLEQSGTGPGRLLRAGLFHTEAGEPLHARLSGLYDSFTELLAEEKPDECAIEEVFFTKRAKTQSETVHARGVIILACARAGVPPRGYNPRSIKQNLTGSGSAAKPQMQRMVQLILKLDKPLEPDDVSDAAAIALFHARRAPFERLVAAGRRK
jgi:crossover junction endodeoxyribonuclease RuvC